MIPTLRAPGPGPGSEKRDPAPKNGIRQRSVVGGRSTIRPSERRGEWGRRKNAEGKKEKEKKKKEKGRKRAGKGKKIEGRAPLQGLSGVPGGR